MTTKHKLTWRILLAIYGIYYFFILLSLASVQIDEFLILDLVLAAGHAMGLTSLYLYGEGIRIGWSKVIKRFFFGVFGLFVILNSFSMLLVLVVAPEIFFDLMPFSLLDLLPFPLAIVALYCAYKVFGDFKAIGPYNFLWNFYFWISVVGFMGGFIAMVFEFYKWTFCDYVSAVYLPLSIVPLYSFVKKKQIFSTKLWKVLFVFSLAWSAFEFAYLLGLRNYIQIHPQLRTYADETTVPWYFCLMFIAVSLPYFYAFYKIAFDKNFFKK